MKKSLILTICILFCWAVQAQKLDTISFSIDKVELCEVNGYTRVSMLSCKTTVELGSPELPYLELSYILPYDSKISSISIIDSTKVLLSNNVVIYPKQPEYPMDDTIQHDFWAPNREIYEGNMAYPYKPVEVSQQFYEKGYHIAKVNVYPICYIPVENRIELYTNIQFQINYETCTSVSIRPLTQSKYLYDLTEKVIYNRIRNKSDFNLCDKGPLNIPPTPNTPAHNYIGLLDMECGVDPEFIIITNNYDINGNLVEDVNYPGMSMTDVFQELADWKTKSGIPKRAKSTPKPSSKA